jgi:hypothetical protein
MMWMVVLAVAIITAACGDSKSSFLPTAPSALPTSVASVDAGTAGYSTTANGNGRRPNTAIDSGQKVEFEGLIDAVGDNSVLVSGQLVGVTTATVIRKGSRVLQLSDLREQDRVHVTANKLGSVVEALEIKLQNPGEGEVEPPPPPPDPPQVVSVRALDANAFEAGGPNGVDSGSFQLTRTGTTTQLAASLDVTVTLGGTAGAGDYAAITVPVNFPADATTVDVSVTPVPDGLPESPETVELTLAAGDGYTVGTPNTATVTIADMAPPFVNVRATDSDAVEGGAGGVFELSRTGDTSVPLPVTLQFGGTADLSEFRFAGMSMGQTFTFTFGVNQAVISFPLTAIADGVAEPEETVTLSAAPGAGYAVGTTGTIRILSQQ